MRILASAVPNGLYRWYKNVEFVKFEVRLIENQIIFFEIDLKHNKEREVSEDFVMELFALDKVIKERPFLIDRNKDFWVVLNRERRKYRELFKKIKNPRL